jgi:hypothetical protein
MGKTRNWMFSTVETIGQGSSGLSQTGTVQSSISKFFLNIFFLFKSYDVSF